MQGCSTRMKQLMKNASFDKKTVVKSRAKSWRKRQTTCDCRALTSTIRLLLAQQSTSKKFYHARAKYMTSTGYYKNTNSARYRKNWRFVEFYAGFLFACFCFLCFFNPNCFTKSQKYRRRREGFILHLGQRILSSFQLAFIHISTENG